MVGSEIKSHIMAKQVSEASGTGKITLPLSPDGGIDWENVRGSVKKKFLETVNDDITTLEYIGLNNPSTGGGEGEGGDSDEESLEFSKEEVGELLDVVSKLNGLIFGAFIPKVMKHPLLRTMDGKQVPFVIQPEVIDSSFILTKEQHSKLDPRAYKELKKVPLPEWAKKRMNLFMLGSMFLKAQADSAKTAIQSQIKIDLMRAQRQANPPPNNPQPDSDRQPPAAEEIGSLDPGSIPPEMSAP